MRELIQSFDVKAWLLTGGLSLILTSLVTILVMLIKQKIKEKSDILQRKVLNESTMSTLIGFGTDIASLLKAVFEMSSQLQTVVDMLQTTVTKTELSGTNLATFVLECFSKSNLSDEKKAELRGLFEKTFFSNNDQLIESLKAAKISSEESLAAANKIITELRAKVEQQNTELAVQQATRKVRRI